MSESEFKVQTWYAQEPHPLKAWQTAFIHNLMGLYQDRAAMATLRRGAGLPIEYAVALPDLSRYFYGVLAVPADGISRREEEAALAVATLFALYVSPGDPLPPIATEGDMGVHLRHLAGPDVNSATYQRVERRLSTLLATHPDDLADRLRQVIGLLRSREGGPVPIYWAQLFWDFVHWGDQKHPVQQRWAKQFWGMRPQLSPSSDETKGV